MSLSDRLNKRIQLWTVGAGQDGIGQPIQAPALVAEVWAEVLDKDGDLAVEADREFRTKKTNITIRARELPEPLSVHYKGDEYRVDSVLGTNNRTLLLGVVKIGRVVTP